MNEHSKYRRLLDACKGLPAMPTAVVHPCDTAAIDGAVGAARLGLIAPILVGPRQKIEEAATEIQGLRGPLDQTEKASRLSERSTRLVSARAVAGFGMSM